MSKLTAEEREQVIRRYLEGYSLRMVAAEFGISLQRVHSLLCERGVERRQAHVNRRAANYAGVRP